MGTCNWDLHDDSLDICFPTEIRIDTLLHQFFIALNKRLIISTIEWLSVFLSALGVVAWTASWQRFRAETSFIMLYDYSGSV